MAEDKPDEATSDNSIPISTADKVVVAGLMVGGGTALAAVFSESDSTQARVLGAVSAVATTTAGLAAVGQQIHDAKQAAGQLVKDAVNGDLTEAPGKLAAFFIRK